MTLHPHRPTVRFGTITVDSLSFDGALRAISELIEAGHGGAVFTPNVDHVVIAESHEPLRRAYARADLSLADGMPLVWGARLLGRPLPERVAGSELFLPLMQIAADRGWGVYLLGSRPDVAEAAATRLRRDYGVNVVGYRSPAVSPEGTEPDRASIEAINRAGPALVVVALGSPKQELWIDRVRGELGPAVAIGLGAAVDFFVGAQRKAPAWLAAAGCEWLYRLSREPRRLWRRYLLRDPQFARIMIATWWTDRRARGRRRTSLSGS